MSNEQLARMIVRLAERYSSHPDDGAVWDFVKWSLEELDVKYEQADKPLV